MGKTEGREGWEGKGGEEEKGKGNRSVPANENLRLHPCVLYNTCD